MGIIFRVVFNNQGWSGKCKNALSDYRLFKCQNIKVFIGHGRFEVDNYGTCISECWEASLCSSFSWESHLGNFNESRAHGSAYFVYSARDNSLTFWGKSQIRDVAGNRVHFEPFSPLPDERYVHGLRAKDFLGTVWGNSTYRYLSEQQEGNLKQLVGRV